MENAIDEIRKKLELLDDVLQDNCETHDWACYSIRIDEIKEKVNQLEQEIRNKAIDEFVDKADYILGASDMDIYCKESIREIAEKMKGE